MDARQALREADRRFRQREDELAAELADARRDRDNAIRAAHAAGLSTREIAREIGLSQARVAQIVRDTPD